MMLKQYDSPKSVSVLITRTGGEGEGYHQKKRRATEQTNDNNEFYTVYVSLCYCVVVTVKLVWYDRCHDIIIWQHYTTNESTHTIIETFTILCRIWMAIIHIILH